MTYNQLSNDDINKRINEKNLEVCDDYVDTKTPCSFRCMICGKIFTSTYDYVRYWKNNGCSECTQKYKTYNNRIKNIQKNISKNSNFISYDMDSNTVHCHCLICNKNYKTSYESVKSRAMHKPCSSIISCCKTGLTLSQNELELRIKEYGNKIKIINYDILDSINVGCKCEVCGNKWITNKRDLLRGRGCPECAKINRRIHRMRPIVNYEEILDQFDLKLCETVENDVITSCSKIKVICTKCNYEFITSIYYLKKYKIGCVKCNLKERLSSKEKWFVDKLQDKNNHIIMIGKYKSMSDITDFLCTDCNNVFFKSPHDILRNCNCPNCTTNSRLEYYISEWLDDNNIEYNLHKRFDDLRGVNNGCLSYDFYLPTFNVLIEGQGQQHKYAIDYFGGEEQFEIQQEHDRRKREYAKNHNIKLLEIWYYDIDNVDQILLENLFDNNKKSAKQLTSFII